MLSGCTTRAPTHARFLRRSRGGGEGTVDIAAGGDEEVKWTERELSQRAVSALIGVAPSPLKTATLNLRPIVSEAGVRMT